MVKHYIPNTLIDALKFKESSNATIIAGGTDLMVQRRNWANVPPTFPNKVMYIMNLDELNYVKKIDDHLHVGAVTPLSDLLNHKDVPRILKDAIEIMASPALRNCATIAGNIGNASPAGDTLPVLYILEAMIVIESISNSRILPIKDVILAPRKTILEDNEMITEIIIPLPNLSFIKFDKVGGRMADAISKVSFAGGVILKDNNIESIRIAFGAVGPTIIRDKEIEKLYQNISVSTLKEDKQMILDKYKKIINPIDDQRSNKEYRLQVALNLLENFIESL